MASGVPANKAHFHNGGVQALVPASIGPDGVLEGAANSVLATHVDDTAKVAVLQHRYRLARVIGGTQTIGGSPASSLAYDPGGGTYVGLGDTASKGILALSSGAGAANEFDTATGKIGASASPAASKGRILLRDLSNDELLNTAGDEIWAVLSDETTEKLYFFSGPFDDTATVESLDAAQQFKPIYIQRYDLDDEPEDAGLVVYFDSEAAALAPDQITSSELADDSVDTDAVQDGAITNPKLGADCVTGDEIADDSIDSEHYVAGSIDSEHYAAGSVNNAALGADCVSGAEIQDDTLGSEHYAANSVDSDAHAQLGSGDHHTEYWSKDGSKDIAGNVTFDNGTREIGEAGTPVSKLYLKDLQLSGALVPNIKRITNADSPYTVLAADALILCDTTSGAITVNMPAVSAGSRLIEVKNDKGANDVNVARNGADTMDRAAAGRTLDDVGRMSERYACDGVDANWSVL